MNYWTLSLFVSASKPPPPHNTWPPSNPKSCDRIVLESFVGCDVENLESGVSNCLDSTYNYFELDIQTSYIDRFVSTFLNTTVTPPPLPSPPVTAFTLVSFCALLLLLPERSKFPNAPHDKRCELFLTLSPTMGSAPCAESRTRSHPS